ncbi:MAG: DUF2778 domain-containing protein, partial [Alphaproteobacteria bacterium]|nr:DUF2778 domain-containing protein [Alphaproteobacteria bacterium]
FTTRDELEYQFARQDREDLLMNQEKQNGVTDNFTQYGHNFWGTPSENNYGFGSSNISENIERLKKQFMTPNSPLSENNLLNNPSGYQSLLPENENKDLSTDPNCYMNFDGKTLELHNRNGLVNRLDAQSGQDEYQSAKYQNVKNKGPIPEGIYYANQDQRQSLTLENILLKLGDNLGIKMDKKSSWSGNPISWGLKRVWLKPDKNTNTHGRDGFSIHGGFSKGSAGCIDIPWQTDDLSDYLDNCQKSVPVQVKYPKKW